MHLHTCKDRKGTRHTTSSSKRLWLKNQKITSVGEDVETTLLCTVVQMYNGTATVENSMEVPQNIKNRTMWPQAIQLLSKHPEELKAGSGRGYVHFCVLSSIILNSQEADATQSSWINSYTPYIQWHVIQPLKGRILSHAPAWMNWGYHAKRHNLVTNTVWFHLHEPSKVVKFIETESRASGAGGRRAKGTCLTCTGFQICKMKNWGICFTTARIYFNTTELNAKNWLRR